MCYGRGFGLSFSEVGVLARFTVVARDEHGNEPAAGKALPTRLFEYSALIFLNWIAASFLLPFCCEFLTALTCQSHNCAFMELPRLVITLYRLYNRGLNEC